LERASGDALYKRPLRNLFVDGHDLNIIQLVYNYFSAVRKRWPIAWEERGRGYMLNRTNGVRALLRFFRHAYAHTAAPGDMVTIEKFHDQVFKSINLDDSDFTTEVFPPGTSGEAKLFRVLRGKDTV
jgi:hypothetical protein